MFQTSNLKTIDPFVTLSSNSTNNTDNFLHKSFVSNLLHNDNSSSTNNFFQPKNLLFNNQQVIESFDENKSENFKFDLEDESIKKLINKRIANIDKERYQVFFI